MKKLIAMSILIFYSLIGYAKDLHLTEEVLQQRIADNNDLVQAAHKHVEGLQLQTQYFTRSFIPSLSLVYGQESFKYVSNRFDQDPYWGVELGVNLFNGGRDRIQGLLQGLEIQKGESQQKITYFSQLQEGRRLFWKLVYLKHYIKMHERALSLVGRNKSQALKRIRAGLATGSDRIVFEIKEEEIRQQQIRNHLLYAQEEQKLRIVLGLNDKDRILITQDFTHDHNWEDIVEHSEDSHEYMLKPEKLEVASLNLQAEQSSRYWLPKVDAYATLLQNNLRMDYERMSRPDRRQTVFGIKVSWDIENLWQTHTQAQVATAMSQAQELRYQYQRRQLIHKIHTDIQELKMLDSLIHGAESNIEKAQKLYDMVRSEYARGVKNSEDMLMATEKLVASELRKYQILKDYHEARIDIMSKLAL